MKLTNLLFPVDIQLLQQLGLVVLVDGFSHIDLVLLFFAGHDAASRNVRGVCEPDGVVFILQEFALHPENLNIVNLLDVETHLVALLDTVLVLVDGKYVNVVAKRAIVILDFIPRLPDIKRRIVINNELFAEAPLRLETSLNEVNRLPEVVALRNVKVIPEIVFITDLDLVDDGLLLLFFFLHAVRYLGVRRDRPPKLILITLTVTILPMFQFAFRLESDLDGITVENVVADTRFFFLHHAHGLCCFSHRFIV